MSNALACRKFLGSAGAAAALPGWSPLFCGSLHNAHPLPMARPILARRPIASWTSTCVASGAFHTGDHARDLFARRPGRAALRSGER